MDKQIIPRASGNARRSIILRDAATPGGFSAASCTTMQYHCYVLMSAGKLHQALINRRIARYFDSKQAADEFRRAYLAGEIPRPARKRRTPKALAPKATKPTKAPKPAPTPKPPKVIKRATPTARQQLHIKQTKPYQPPPLRKDIPVFWPEHIKPVCRMLPPGPYAASVPKVRIGSPEWRAGVGA